jgi:hypothetical protein
VPRIQRIPRGLLSLLDMKSAAGQTPAELAGFIQGTVDLEAYYLSDQLTSLEATVAAAAVGSTATITVTDGEVWRIIGLSMSADAGIAATVVNAALGVQPAGAPQPVIVLPSMIGTFAANGDRLQSGLMFPPFVLGPGGRITAGCQNVPAAGYTLRVRALFHRLPA